MFTLGFIALLAGAYLVDSAVRDRPPIATLRAVIENPSQAQSTLASSDQMAGAAAGSASPVGSPPLLYGPTHATNPHAPGLSSQLQSWRVPIANVPEVAAQIAAWLNEQLGKPYKWGATGPDAYDCSGLAQAAYASVGIAIPRTTWTQIAIGKRANDLQVADLIFPDPGHVCIYVGNGQIIESPHTGAYVHQIPVYSTRVVRRVLHG